MARPRLAPLTLWLAAAAFAGPGLAFLLAPGLLRYVDLAPASATARSDVRALFGGLETRPRGVPRWLRPAAHAAGLRAAALAIGVASGVGTWRAWPVLRRRPAS